MNASRPSPDAAPTCASRWSASESRPSAAIVDAGTVFRTAAHVGRTPFAILKVPVAGIPVAVESAGIDVERSVPFGHGVGSRLGAYPPRYRAHRVRAFPPASSSGFASSASPMNASISRLDRASSLIACCNCGVHHQRLRLSQVEAGG